jgi:hypothetical protein
VLGDADKRKVYDVTGSTDDAELSGVGVGTSHNVILKSKHLVLAIQYDNGTTCTTHNSSSSTCTYIYAEEMRGVQCNHY